MPETAAAATVRVVKRKWDGAVSTVDNAHRLTVPGETSAWLVPAGSRRERPSKGTLEVVGSEELWVAAPGEWWILCGYLDATRSLIGYKVHASAPFESPSDDRAITWVDLDLDFEVDGHQLALLDEDEFHAHARTMAYPDHVVRGAWSGIATIAARYTNGDWPFDGSMQDWVDGSKVERTLREGHDAGRPRPRLLSRGPAGEEDEHVTTNDQTSLPPAASVVPRWEWRTFGDLDDSDQALAPLRGVAPVESDETYVLSMFADTSVKVRGGLLDIKVLERVNGAGLQLWVPTVKAAFPLDEGAHLAALTALGVPLRTTGRSDHGAEGFLDELVGAGDDLCVVQTHKSRRRSVLDDCMVELTEVSVEGRSVRTVAIESPDPDLVVETVHRLGLERRRNVCVPQGLKALIGWGPTRFAVLDIGTNSVKFTLGDRQGRGGPRIEAESAVVTRLGEGLEQAGELTPVAMRRTVDAVAGLVDDARRDGPLDIVAVGTAGLRKAPNRDAFVDSVFARSGVAVEVISGQEEARLAYLAAVSALPLTGDRLLVLDSGGGSSQFTFGSGDRIEEQFSLDVGAVRFTERFGLADAVPRETVDAALAAIAADLETLAGRPRADMVIAIGGTSTNLAAVEHGLVDYDPDVVHGTVVGVADVDRQIEAYRGRSADQRREIAGLQPARAEVILAGACILRTILTLTGQDAVTVSDRGLRHGVLAERFSS